MNQNNTSFTSSNHPTFSICSPENSPEIQELSDATRVKIPDIFRKNISPQMAELLGRLPIFEELISRKHRIFSQQIYYFITSRGYEVPRSTSDARIQYDEAVGDFIRR